MDWIIPVVLVVIALVIIVVIAVLIAYLVVRRSSLLNNSIDTISMLPYIMPGAVVGLSLLLAFGQKPIALTGTFAIMVISFVIRRDHEALHGAVAVDLECEQAPGTFEHVRHHQGPGHGASERSVEGILRHDVGAGGMITRSGGSPGGVGDELRAEIRRDLRDLRIRAHHPDMAHAWRVPAGSDDVGGHRHDERSAIGR